MSAMTFLLGMLSPRTNVKGMIAGYIGGMIPLTCSFIGMFFIPRHKSFYNSTGRVLTYHSYMSHINYINYIHTYYMYEQGLKIRNSKKCRYV